MILYRVKYSKSLHTGACAGTWQVIYVLKFSHHPDDRDGVGLWKVIIHLMQLSAQEDLIEIWRVVCMWYILKNAKSYFLFKHCWVKEQEPQNLAMSASHFHSQRNTGGLSWQQHTTYYHNHLTHYLSQISDRRRMFSRMNLSEHQSTLKELHL